MTQPGKRHAKVNIVTVSYRNHGDTRAFLDSLATVRGFQECNVTVVNNAVDSEDLAELDEIAASFGGSVTMVNSVENLYYWGGANSVILGLVDSGGCRVDSDWIIICNNDVLFTDSRFLEKLCSYDTSEHGVIAPSIISLANGRDQNPFLRKPPGMLRLLKGRLLYSGFHVARMFLAMRQVADPVRQWMNRRQVTGGARGREDIYAPHGAFVVFSRRYFECGGWLDTTVPMYTEEITTGAIAEQIGVPVRYCPDLQVHHRRHATTGNTLTRLQWSRENEGFTHLRQHYSSSLGRRRDWKPVSDEVNLGVAHGRSR